MTQTGCMHNLQAAKSIDYTNCIVHHLQVAGVTTDQDEEEKTLKGLLMVGHLNIDPSGKEMPWPIPAIGFGNGAHLALAELRCTSDAPPDKAS